MIDALSKNELAEVNSQALFKLATESSRSASESLSTWLNSAVQIETDGFDCVKLTAIGEIAGDADEPIVAVHMPLEGELTGHVLLALPETEALDLVQTLTHSSPTEAFALAELERSCIQETGNIVGSSFSNALSRWLRMTTIPGVPFVMHDLASAVVAPLLCSELAMRDEVYMTRTRFLVNGRSVDWKLVLIFTDDVLVSLREHAEREQIVNYELGQLFDFACATAVNDFSRKSGVVATAKIERFNRSAFSQIRKHWDVREILIYSSELTEQPANRLFMIAAAAEVEQFGGNPQNDKASAQALLNEVGSAMRDIFRGRLGADVYSPGPEPRQNRGLASELLETFCDLHQAADHECFSARIQIRTAQVTLTAIVYLAVHVESYKRLGSIHL